MEYIIFDLEWDSVFYKPEKRFINQILQIGAVKTDESFNVIDTFMVTIHSEISKKVSTRFAELTGITTEKMRLGIPYAEAVKQFNEFSKNADIAMTWSDSDLYTIIDNERLLPQGAQSFALKQYLDLQKLVQQKMYKLGYESKNQVSLENAAAFFGENIEDFAMHTALDDSKVCSILLKKCFDQEVFASLLRDTADPSFYERLRFKPKPITDINDSRLDKSKFDFTCPVCNCKLMRLSKWKHHNRWFSSPCKCAECGDKYIARVFAKSTFDGVNYKRKLTKIVKKKPTDEMQLMSKTV